MSTIKYWFIFFMLLALTGCGQETIDGPKIGASEQSLEISGKIVFDNMEMEDVRVVLVSEDSEQYQQFDAVTDEHGVFTIEVPTKGTYSLLAAKKDPGGIYSAVLPDKQIEDSENINTLALNFYEVDFENTDVNIGVPNISMDQEPQYDHSGEYSSIEQELGPGSGCLAVGCSRRECLWDKARCMCCGYSACLTGMEICLPYWFN